MANGEFKIERLHLFYGCKRSIFALLNDIDLTGGGLIFILDMFLWLYI